MIGRLKNYAVIWERPINVNGKRREPQEQFEEEETRELKNLVKHKYVVEVK